MAIENGDRLKAVGPVDPTPGFPLWFEDEKGVRLELGLNLDPLNPDPLIPALGEIPAPAEALAFPKNFPDESFYFMAEAELDVGGDGQPGRARVILALEAAFGGAGEPKQGLNVVFARIRVRMDKVRPGAKYKVTHPYGEIDFDTLVADDRGRVFYTEDLGIVEGDPTAVLRSGQVAPFLEWDSGAPEGYIGDGVTPHKVIGSPFGTNFVRIEGPNIHEGSQNNDPLDPSNPNIVWTDEFSVQGKKATRVGAWVEGATYAAAAGGFKLSIYARSKPNQDLRLVGTGLHLKLDNEGEFYTGLGQAITLPTDAQLVNVSDSPPTRYPVVFTDLVLVDSAIYDRNTRTLAIQAKSSDPGAVLTLPQFNNLQLLSNPFNINVAAVPFELTVQSTRKGEGRHPIEVVGDSAANLPSAKAIIAPPPPQVFAGEPLTLDGSGSLGSVGFVWSQKNTPPDPGVTPSSANTAQFTFTPPVAGNYTLSLRVQGSDGSFNETDIRVTVQPRRGPDTFTDIRAEYRTGTRQFRIDGVVNQVPNVIVVKFKNQEIGRSAVDITGNWSVRRVLLEEIERELEATQGDGVQVISRSDRDNDPLKASVERPLVIRN